MIEVETIRDQQAYFSFFWVTLLWQISQTQMSFAGLVLLREGKGQLLDCKLVEDDEWSVDADVVNGRRDDADDVIATELGPGNP
jgi:hypothetical protein